HMKNRSAVRYPDNWPVGKDALHTRGKHSPLFRAMKIVAHEESAAVQKLPHLLHLEIGELPVAHFNRIQPGIVEGVRAVVKIHRLLHRADMYAGEPPNRDRDMPIGRGVVGRPTGSAMLPVGPAESAAEASPVDQP